MRKLFVCVCLVQLLVVGMLRAQANRATITGTVTDASKGAMAGVEVTAKNLGTDALSTTVTNEEGIYTIPNLFPGAYSLEFKKDGFKSVLYPSITLESTQVAQMNSTLQVGMVNENVTVTANAPVIERENAAIGTNMKGDVVTDLPLSVFANGGRDIESFALAITPGYSPSSSTYNAVVNGNQWFTKDFTVDGTSATATIQGDSVEIGPSMEAVQELQAQTSGLDAQSGITNGGVMAFNIKSGTNKFHGSAFGYHHNEFLDANTWTNNNQGLPKTRARAWDYGGSLGGPVFKNRTYFFGTFERFTKNNFTLAGYGQAATVPTAAFLNGDFGVLLNKTQVLGTDTHGNPIYSGAIFNPADPGAVFVNNQIPTTMFSSVSKKIIPLYQKYYAPSAGGLSNNDRVPINNTPSETPNQAVVKLDHVLTQNDRLSGSWIYNHRPRMLNDSGGVWQEGSMDGGPFSDVRFQMVRSHEFRASESHTFSPNLLNVFNVTYNWYWNGSVPVLSGTNWAQQLGFGNTGTNNFPSIGFGDAVNNVGETGIGNTWQGNYVGATMITGDSVTWTKGRHAITFGGDFRSYEINSHAGSGALNFSFTNATTGAPGKPYAGQVGFGFASFLLGDATSAGETTPFDLYGRRKAMSLYAQDNYKISPKLTLNLGLRWDATFRFHEKYGHWANFDLNRIDPTLGIPGSLVFANGGGTSFEQNEYWKNFGPQIGFAYSPLPKWVFRGSFSITYAPIGTQYFHGVPYGFAPGFQGTNNVTKAFNWDSGYPGVFLPGSKNVDVTQLFTVVSVQPNALRAGYTDNFNVGAQYELTPNTRVEVAYVGNRGHRLPDTALQYNEATATKFFNLINSGNGYNYVCSAADATANGVPYPYNGFCAPAVAAIAPYPQIAATMDNYYYNPLFYVGLPLAQSYYDSMIVDVVKRAGSGLTMDMSYTLSRSRGNSYTAFQETYADYTGVQNFANLAESARTLTNYDQTHVIKGFLSYQLPFGNGKKLAANKGRVVKAIVSGWSLTGLVTYYTGMPFSAVVPNPYYPAWGNIYPNYNLSGYKGPTFNRGQWTPPVSGMPTPASDFYLPAGVASAPAYGQLGTGPVRVGALRCPGYANEDASILKYFSMGLDGQYKLSFRVEYYNLFNRHYFGIKGCYGEKASVSSGQPIGLVTGVNSSPRTGQFGLRFTF
jgi:hypothetical protein